MNAPRHVSHDQVVVDLLKADVGDLPIRTGTHVEHRVLAGCRLEQGEGVLRRQDAARIVRLACAGERHLGFSLKRNSECAQ